MRVLVTEDDETMARLVEQALVEEGHEVDVVFDGERAVDTVARSSYDLVLLDVMLPGLDGFTTCARMRDRGAAMPILMLTARDDVDDRVRGLDAGADDYLCKPFSLAELLARVRALQRRGPAHFSSRLAVGALTIDAGTLTALRGGRKIDLTPREFAILEVLMREPGRIVARHVILERGWQGAPEHHSNVIEVLIRRIRDKIDRPFGTDSIETVRGVGYRMRT
jgi:two-component system OmpR family response regulator